MDIQAALKDGYSKEDVMAELGKRTGMNYKAALKDGHSPDDVLAELNKRDTRKSSAPTNNPADYPQGKTAADQEAMRRKFLQDEKDNKTLAEKVEPYVPTRQTLATLTRPILEGGGAVLGGIVGAGGGTVATPGLGTLAGGVAGAGLGYAMGKNVADTIQGDYAKTPTEAVTRSLKDIGTGATYEMGGQVVGNLAGQALSKVAPYISKTPLQDMARRRAAQTLQTTSELSPQETANFAKSQQLTDKLGVQLTPAQRTGNPTLSVMEQNLATTDPAFNATLNAQDNAAKAAALAKVRQSTGAGRPVPSTQDLATTGQDITDKLTSTLKPIKEAERAIWEKVPDYPMPSDNIMSAVKTVTSSPMDEETASAVHSAVKFIQAAPKTTKGLQAIDQTLGSDITRASRAGNNKVSRALGILRDGIKADFEAMGTAAEVGDVALHEGKVVFPSKLQTELATIEQQIAAETGKAAKPDIQAMQKALMGKRIPAMRQMQEPEAKFNQRIIDQFSKSIGSEIPTVPGASSPVLDNLAARQATLKGQLDNLQPAENVANAYTEAKRFSKEQKFDRFGKGAVSRVLGKGNEASGLRTSDENIARQFFTPSGSIGLIKAVGKTAAKEQMHPFVMADIVKAAAPDGVTFNVQAGINYIQKNRPQLERLGLVNEARQVIKDQMPAEFERILAKRSPDPVTGQQFYTSNDMRQILQKYGNTIKQMYGVETLNAFRDYGQLMGMIERKATIPRGGGSNTVDKAVNLANSMIKESVGPARKMTDGLLGALAQGAGIGGASSIVYGHSTKSMIAGGAIMAGRQAVKNANTIVAQSFTKILQEATLNPQVAKDLMSLQKTGKVPATLQTIIDKHLAAGTAIAITSNSQGEQP